MTRKFITPEQSAKDLLFALNHSYHRDIYINNKPSTPITELAQQMISDSGKNIPVKFIGMRPGEKLEEEDYPASTISTTKNKTLFLLTKHQHTAESIRQAINLLNKKAKPETINKIKALFKTK
jgi:FlaA1/EpsC-like NDP-sugar epimerase